MRRTRGIVFIAWGICLALLIHSIVLPILVYREHGSLPAVFQLVGSGVLFPLLFAIPGALIISRHPRHVIGWLLIGPQLVIAASDWMQRYLENFKAAPPPSTPLVWFMILFSTGSWMALIFPLMLIPLLFPTGRPLTPRWRWTIYLAIGMLIFFYFWASSTPLYQPDFASWTMRNPVGFLSQAAADVIMQVWTALLAVLSIASLSSVIIRYRHSSAVERQQMKWLLYACAIFGLFFLPSLYAARLGLFTAGSMPELFSIFFPLAIIAIPASIAIAILRYHLFEIDVIIRLTLVYALVTGLLGLVYGGGIVLLQGVFRTLTGQTSSLAVVITTLAIAALFTPLRQRVQALIDRRFFRQKYNAEQSLAEFALAARSGTDLDQLTAMLVEITQKTLQPTQVSLQLTEVKNNEV